MTTPLASIVLAAGKGTRFRSALPKVLHPLLGQPLVRFPLERARELNASPSVVVIGHGAEAVRQVLPPDVRVALQPEQRGTGDAVRVGLEALDGFSGPVLILSGDAPLLSGDTLARLLALPGELALVTARAPDPLGYGRIVRGSEGLIAQVIEERDASPAERAIAEVNAGVYRIEAAFLRQHLRELQSANAQGELYLTDLIARAARAGRVFSVSAPFAEVAGVNDRRELAEAARRLRAAVNAAHQAAGVTLIDPATTYIELDVQLAPDVTVEPNCQLLAGTTVGRGTLIRANSVLESAQVGEDCRLGPFARLRPGTVLARGVHLGNFVEVKQARIGEGSKANHLSYLGDATIGAGVNVGAGTITCNYDGVNKFRTVLGDGVFVGSDSQLVAPVEVGAGAYLGAGSTIDENIPADALAFTRAPLVIKEGWAARRRAARKKSE